MLSVLGEIGQFVRPMSEAPRDGRKILGQSAGGLVICYWDAKPLKLAGPTWVDAPDAERGYLDKYFTGWLDPAKLKLLDYAALGACPNSRCSILSESDSSLGYEQVFSALEYRSDTAAAAECAGLCAERPCLAVYRRAGAGEP